MRIRGAGHHRGKKHHRARLVAAVGLSAAAVGAVAFSGHTPQPAEAATSVAAFPSTANVVTHNHTWVPVIRQNFTTTAALGSFAAKYGTAWAGYSGFNDTSNKGVYDPKDVLSVHDGVLDYWLRTVAGKPRVAAAMPNGYNPQTYGRYAIRFRTDAVAGYKMAFLLWPTSNNWNDGEIDWPDGNLAGKAYPASAIRGSFKNGAMSFDKPSQSVAPTIGTGWHTAVTEWSSGHVRWYLDGVELGETSKTAGVPVKPMRWTLQAETNTDGKAVSSTVKGHILIDWVVQYKLK